MRSPYFILAILCSLLFFGCEEDITVEIPAGEEQLVVEGHIEQEASPVVVLTRTVPVFTEVSVEALAKSFVHDAQVRVTVDGQTYTLDEVPLAALPQELKELIAVQFGLRPEFLSTEAGALFYVYTSQELKGEVGKSYRLHIRHAGRELSAVTTIPHLNPLDSLYTIPHPNPEEDSLRQLYYRYSDPDTLGNTIRYFTKRNSEPFYPGLFASVFSDEFINGATIDYPLDRGEPKGQQEVDVDLYSYFGKGDTVTVRWAAIDQAHYRFWFTLENEQNNNGSPISSPNITRSNIQGGLGIWGGYGVSYHTLIIE
ncbi:DUF4249 domain-containing protein [Pontibacter flavimaris]|uniref:DUF4249 domain-containing protein n=1 Tax=Pontibacter flavimaris TaxID=1797110 RepID=A0A1Q5PHB5_9BACT|nr:DUF4249 domain-containing protein [Pontibacter flavimaris]OKL41532.1 hypothetical protein A3841_10815 [Pontibacter flavimaris]